MSMAEDIHQTVAQGQQDWAFSVGVQLVVWGLPIVECWKYRLGKVVGHGAQAQGQAINAFQHMRSLSTRASSKFVNSATDFLYSTAVLDLHQGPLVLTAPDFQERWYGLQVLDPYMETLANLGTRTYGRQLPSVVIANRRDQHRVPAQATVIYSDSDFLYVVGRIAAGDHEDLSAVNALQDGLRLTPLHGADHPGFDLAQVTPGSCAPLRAGDSSCPAELAFFEELGAVLKFVPPSASEGMLLGLMADVGISVENGFAHQSLAPAVREGLARAVVQATAILQGKVFERGELNNGWKLPGAIGNYGHDYILRALVSLHGIWANVAEESLYFMAWTDCEGNLLHGDNQYEIRFEAGQLPPVEAFWSISYYDDQGRLTDNPQDKYTVNSLYHQLQANADGSTSVFIGKAPVAPPFAGNWLPSHSGYFNLNLRCYNPGPALLSGQYRVAPIVRIQGQ
ncbi:DUF1254 domain-containing protein [Pseudomonas sp. BIGb0427]|uniref:DUF1254 domain-containing protein n=1 Tax=unclassified Pseudomonas TaxID=196821 RepID=UPI00087FF9C4|nr:MULTISPECIES: DUF1254 domain-containing protein [unclassified Pseudomonas]QPG62219.1 DUF1254 domain-containing protein [Pseudomonas sp. BIGb0427]QVM99034.1 DUF1254 domain-containing protein [Pseudomonas sp. SORT22]UVL54095.1 DUF1214 domain-containing protein [Pseudomonas sp. B21-035]UVM64558.1 DUF1214 domain-containing protein [Pseudomonas sp. B21-009]SDQ66320.1 Uncharacterized conserved protein [Pseudomonas sp. UC 17F4]